MLFFLIDEVLKLSLLIAASFLQPLPISKHQDVGPYWLFAFGASWQIFAAHCLLVDFGLKRIRGNRLAIVALKMIDATMNLVYTVLWVFCLKEVSVNVRCDCEKVVFVVGRVGDRAGHLFEKMIAFVRLLGSVHL